MELKIQKYLYDIITSIHSIYDYLGENRDFNEYSENKLLRRAVERELEIIGEASKDQFNIRVDISNIIYFMIDIITTLFIATSAVYRVILVK